MKLVEEARQIIAAYLTGLPVAYQTLQDACKILESNTLSTQRLMGELGCYTDWINECAMFRERLAEFSEMSQQERQAEMPTLVTHVEVCPPCRRAFWEVKPLWEAVGVITGKIKTTCRRLTEPIRLTIDKAGKLRMRGCGPLPLHHAFVAAVMAAPTEEWGKEEQEEWNLKDEDGQYSIRLVVCGLSSGKVAVNYALEGEPGVIPQAQDIRLEVCKTDRSMPIASGPLSNFQAQPIQLRKGSWVLRLQIPSPPGNRTWEIPLDIEVEQTGESQ